jgi:hypothetical protein
MGDAADICNRVDRLGNVERKLDDLIAMLKPMFGDHRIRTAINVALTTESLRALRK